MALPIPASRALKKLGGDLREARIRRRIPMSLMSERACICRTTLTKVEQGSPSVSMGIYASVLFVLGMTERLSDLVDFKIDDVGRVLEQEHLPKRVRLRASKK